MTTQLPIPLERTREFWERAARYPIDKEAHYPDHAAAQDFDRAAHKVVLEYGCGGGSDVLSYLRRDAAQVFACDVVHSNVETTVSRAVAAGFERKIALKLLDASDRIELPSGSIDIVNAHGVVHHIVDPAPVLAEFFRLLKPGGTLTMMLYTAELEARFASRIDDLVQGEKKLTPGEAFAWCTDEEGAPYARSYTTDQGRALLEGAGFLYESSMVYNNGDFRTFRARKPGAVEAPAQRTPQGHPTTSGKKKKGGRK